MGIREKLDLIIILYLNALIWLSYTIYSRFIFKHIILIYYSPKQALWYACGRIIEPIIQASQIGILSTIRMKMKDPSL